MFSEGSQIGNYTLIKKLGRGGFGEVWLAERRAKFVTTKVAVKLPLDEQVDHEAIKQEATLWEQASGHPNILPIIDADEYDGQIVIVSEYAPDGSLEEWLKTNGAMSVERAIETTIQILDGLEFLHSRNIIHRDLKPANILLQGTTPRLADFGISRALRTTVASQSQNISGTFAYMSPEALDGKRSVQTDVWSVGVNLYQFLTGTLPFPQKEPSVLLAAIMMREFAPLPDSIPQNLKNVMAKALAKLPENRYVSANEMREDLRRILKDKDISPRAESETETIVKPKFSTNSIETQVANIQPNLSNIENDPYQSKIGEMEAVVRDIKSENLKANVQNSKWLNIVALCSLIIIGLSGIYILIFLGSEMMEKNSQVTNSRNINAANYDFLGNTNSPSNIMGNRMMMNYNSPRETVPTAKIVGRFVWMGANFSAPIQKGSVTVLSNGKTFRKKTSNQGWLVLDGVPCNQTVTFSFGEDGVMSKNPGESTMPTGGKSNQTTKFINCSDKPVPVGLFDWERGEVIQNDMDNVDGCYTCQ